MKGKEILCPYCCTRFLPNEVHFRMERPETMEAEGTEETNRQTGNKSQNQEDFDMMGFSSFDNQSDQSSSSRLSASNIRQNTRQRSQVEDKILDQKLYDYYIQKLNMSTADARNNAMQYGFVEFNLGNPNIDYNDRELAEYGYVNEITYKGQRLKKRLCPNCHKDIVAHAGKYDMKMISVIGDTNVGKTVFLTILQQIIKNDNFDGTLYFMGSDEERELYFGNFDKLINKKEMNKATDRLKIPPLPFLFSFSTSDSKEEKKVLIIFCDIAGEDCRNHLTLEQNGFHLEASSGLLFLIDPTRFSLIRNSIESGENSLENMYQVEVITAINRYLIASSHREKVDIPAAIVLSKSDVLKDVAYFRGNPDKSALLENRIGSSLQQGYIDAEEVRNLDNEVQSFLVDIQEKDLCNSKKLFQTYNFFLCSALGKAPEVQKKDVLGAQALEKVVNGNIHPLRVSEAFYWILMKNGLIPCKYVEKWQDKKGRQETIEEFYYCGREDELYQRLATIREKRGIKDTRLFNKWTLISKTGL